MEEQVVIPAEIKDSGDRTLYDTGARRDLRSGKGRYDLLPVLATMRLAKHFEGGAIKYGIRNWEKGIPLSSYMDSAMRHLYKYLVGMRDEDHLVACVWNLMCLMDTETSILVGTLPKELNDLPKPMDPKVVDALMKLLGQEA